MSGLYGTFKTNQKSEREGRWFDLVGVVNPDNSMPGFRMARMGKSNPEYQAAIERHSKDLRTMVELDTLTENIAGPIMQSVFIDTVLLDWRNVYDDSGKEIPYSKENAAKLFDDLPDLYLTLVEQAQKLANFRDKEVEAVSKKSPPPSKPRSENGDT